MARTGRCGRGRRRRRLRPGSPRRQHCARPIGLGEPAIGRRDRRDAGQGPAPCSRSRQRRNVRSETPSISAAFPATARPAHAARAVPQNASVVPLAALLPDPSPLPFERFLKPDRSRAAKTGQISGQPHLDRCGVDGPRELIGGFRLAPAYSRARGFSGSSVAQAQHWDKGKGQCGERGRHQNQRVEPAVE